jgi:predicted extracellular nuclease
VTAGNSSLLTVTVKPALNPPSTGVAVTGDLSSIGGSATQTFYDDGSHGDVTAGDNVFSFLAAVPASSPVGIRNLPISVRDTEGRTSSTTLAVTVTDSCGDPKRPINAVQGTGPASPLAGSDVTIEGVVVRSYQGAGEFGGFYVQEATPDDNPASSEGIFVFSSLRTVAPGDVVRVHGQVTEFASGSSSLTELTNVAFILPCGSGASVPETDITLPVASMSDFERYEGMLVRFPQTLTVSDTFTLGRFGELRLAEGGRLYQPTAITTPGPAAIAQQDLNRRRSFVLDDGNNQQNIDPTRYPIGGLSATNTLRSGYTTVGLTGVFDERFSTYRMQPVGPVSFAATNPRTDAPEEVGGNLRAASFNVLNLFNGNGTHQEGAAGGFPTSRGANSLFEFDRQLAKEVSALRAINADVVGLMEIENDAPPRSALEDLVAALNAAMGAGTYAFINTGVIGTDEIKTALIYKPAKVRPVGSYELLTSADDPRFIDTRSRPVLAQTFELTSNLERVTVAVNHLKSKGSACDDIGDPDTGDGQGNCNVTRTNAARAEVDWLAHDPTDSGSSDVLAIGDFNSYTFEDPITVFTSAGFENLTRRFRGLDAYSYVFDGQSGYLDHALASRSLAPKATGVSDWHINADEPIVLDYNVEFKTANQVDSFYAPGPYRASDHDPVIIGLGLHPSFARVCELTRAYVEKAGVANALCAKLEAAEAADARGNANAKAGSLGAYVNQLRAQSGKAITAERASFLISLVPEL